MGCCSGCGIRGVGCFIGSVYVGALAYADDVLYFLRMRRLLLLCADYCKSVRITGQNFLLPLTRQNLFGCIFTRRARLINGNMHFYVDGKDISRVTQCNHFGHVISANMNDRHDILNRRNSVCWKLNNL